jgi:multicomponent Na+:H+ antiporter subunit D
LEGLNVSSPVPLVVAPLLLVLAVLTTGQRRRLQAALLLTVALFCLGWSIVLASTGASASVPMSGWSPPLGIGLRADALSRLFLLLNAVIFVLAALSLLAKELRQQGDSKRSLPRSLSHAGLLLGLNGLFLTADFFNFYVFFELMSVSAFLLVVDGARKPLEAGWKFAVQSMLGSICLLTGVAFLYGLSGSLAMHDVAARLGQSPTIWWTSSLFLFAFLLKGSLFPFHWWQADAHAAATTAGSVVLAGAIINTGIYGVMRFWPLLYGDGLLWLLAVIGAGSLTFGALAAYRTDDAKRLLGYSSTSQLGYVLLALAWSAPHVAVFYLIAHALAKALLFLVTGMIGDQAGTLSLRGLQGFGLHHPLAGYAYLLGFLSLIGFPPTMGFVAKVGVFGAGIAGAGGLGVTLIVVGSLATLGYAARAHQAIFMGNTVAKQAPALRSPGSGQARERGRTWLEHASITLAVLFVVLGWVFAGPLWRLCSTVARAAGVPA